VLLLSGYLPEENTVEYTRFEKARIIGARALQLSMGAPSTLAKIPKNLVDPIEIAMVEFNEDAIPITVKRTTII
jgi:DNA-directed RNA polymerase subunit K